MSPKENSKDSTAKEDLVIKRSYSVFFSSLAFALLLSALIFYFYSWPRFQSYEQNIEGIQAKQNTIENKTARLNVLRAENLNREPDEEELGLSRSIPSDNDVPNLIRELDSISRLAQEDLLDDTYLKSFSIGIPAKKEGERFFTTNISASFSSYAFSLPKLLKEFEEDEHRLYNIKSINISFTKRDKVTSDLLSPELDKEYHLLLLKRANFLLEDSERLRLQEIQQEINASYEELLNKGSRSESEEERFEQLRTEVDKIKSERNYSLTMETYNT